MRNADVVLEKRKPDDRRAIRQDILEFCARVLATVLCATTFCTFVREFSPLGQDESEPTKTLVRSNPALAPAGFGGGKVHTHGSVPSTPHTTHGLL